MKRRTSLPEPALSKRPRREPGPDLFFGVLPAEIRTGEIRRYLPGSTRTLLKATCKAAEREDPRAKANLAMLWLAGPKCWLSIQPRRVFFHDDLYPGRLGGVTGLSLLIGGPIDARATFDAAGTLTSIHVVYFRTDLLPIPRHFSSPATDWPCIRGLTKALRADMSEGEVSEAVLKDYQEDSDN
jgi:hypothetical protein